MLVLSVSMLSAELVSEDATVFRPRDSLHYAGFRRKCVPPPHQFQSGSQFNSVSFSGRFQPKWSTEPREIAPPRFAEPSRNRKRQLMTGRAEAEDGRVMPCGSRRTFPDTLSPPVRCTWPGLVGCLSVTQTCVNYAHRFIIYALSSTLL